MRCHFAGMTDIGLQREHNEDSFLILAEYRLMAVADGMGGHRSGDVASRLAAESLQEFFTKTVQGQSSWPFRYEPTLNEEENAITTAVRWANRRIYDRGLQNAAESGMGTTVVLSLFNIDASTVTIGHVGDSRCYRFRRGELQAMTRDHSLISDASQLAPWLTPEEIRQIPSNVITRALGIRDDVLVDLTTEHTHPGDRYLLCSDGLNGMIPDDQIAEILESIADPDEACKALIERANFFGGADNITVVIADLAEGEPEPTAKSVAPPPQIQDEETFVEGSASERPR